MNTLFATLEWPSSAGLWASTMVAQTLKDYLVYCGVILVLAAIVFFWALAIRKPKKRRRKRMHHSTSKRNPTLAETRGLPPMRDEQPPRHGDFST